MGDDGQEPRPEGSVPLAGRLRPYAAAAEARRRADVAGVPVADADPRAALAFERETLALEDE